jgi:hypothetical protein
MGWDYGCDFEVIDQFRRPLTLSEMRADLALQDWGALRADFRDGSTQSLLISGTTSSIA